MLAGQGGTPPTDGCGTFRRASGAFYLEEEALRMPTFTAGKYQDVDNAYKCFYLSASRSSAVYGNSSTVQPPAISTQYVIKY